MGHWIIDFGKISNRRIKTIGSALGIPIAAYRHQMDSFAFAHILKRHSNITLEDFLIIPDIIAAPDEVLYEGLSKQGLHMIKYSKNFGETFYYIEEVRTGRKVLSVKTMYKIKKPSSTSHIPLRT